MVNIFNNYINYINLLFNYIYFHSYEEINDCRNEPLKLYWIQDGNAVFRAMTYRSSAPVGLFCIKNKKSSLVSEPSIYDIEQNPSPG